MIIVIMIKRWVVVIIGFQNHVIERCEPKKMVYQKSYDVVQIKAEKLKLCHVIA